MDSYTSSTTLLSSSLEGAKVLLVGGNRKLVGRIKKLVRAKADVTLICSTENDEDNMTAATIKCIFKHRASGQITFIDRDLADEDIHASFDYIVVCVDSYNEAWYV